MNEKSANMQRVVAIVSYSSLERMFIRDLLAQVSLFADGCYVACADRLYTGQQEPEPGDQVVTELWRSLGELGKLGKSCDFAAVKYAVTDDDLSDPVSLHNRARQVAVDHDRARNSLGLETFETFYLFLDADEVPDGEAFRAFLQSRALERDCAYKLGNYWYFLAPTLRATEVEDSVLLVHSSWVDTLEKLAHPRERDGIIIENLRSPPPADPNPKPNLKPESNSSKYVLRQVLSDAGKPMFHHYSWVRSLDGLLAKVRGWGHRGQRDWEGLVRAAFAQLEAGRYPAQDFVHGYPLVTVPPHFTMCHSQ